MSSLILTPEELKEVTHRVKYSAQIKQLQRMGIEYKRSAIGAPIVSRAAFQQAMGVREEKNQDSESNFKLNLDFLESKKK